MSDVPERVELARLPSRIPPAPGAPGADTAGQEIPTLRQLGAALVHRFRLVLALALLGGILGVLASRLVQPEYSAQVTLWIEAADQTAAARGPIRTREFLDSHAWVDLARSYSVLDLVAREERLYLSVLTRNADPAFYDFRAAEELEPGSYELRVSADGRSYELLRGKGERIETGPVGEAIGSGVGFLWKPDTESLAPGAEIRFEIIPIRDAAAQLAASLEPTMAPEGHFLRLALQSSDPELAARVLNTTAEQFVSVAAELKRLQLDELAGILKEQLDFAAANLQTEEATLERFRVQTITLPTDRAMPVNPGIEATREPAFENFFQLSVEREALRRERSEMDHIRALGETSEEGLNALRMSEVGQRSPVLTRTLEDELAKRSEMQALLLRYTPDHPLVQQREAELRTLQGMIAERLGELDRALEERRSSVDEMISSASLTLREIPPRMVEEARLQRQADVAENLYRNLQQRYEEARLAAVSSLPDVRVQDAASVPYYPINDRRLLIVLAALFAGIGVGAIAAVVAEMSDPRLRNPEQVTRQMGLPVLGALPLMPDSGKATLEQRAQWGEAIRSARINLLHAFGSAPPLTLTITSPGANDGKSMIAYHLADSFADSGQRTLLIDADLRRGQLHRTLKARREPGLTEYLARECSLEEILQPVGTGGLFYFISCGSPRLDGPKLLESPDLTRLLLELRPRFRAIIVDSPPLGATVDPLVLGVRTGNMMLVMRNRVSDRVLAQSKLAAIEQLPIRMMGVVINAVPKSGIYRYYSYLSGYEPQAGELVSDTQVVS